MARRRVEREPRACRGSHGALLWVACELRDLIDGGDHLIVPATVLEAESREGDPLIFHAGAYRPLD